MFYDGPPFATGLPHYGHLLAGTIKDVVPRYWAMHGYSVERRFGWDCHGLPIESLVEDELDVHGRAEIEALGVPKFNAACRAGVLRYTDEWRKVVQRMGRWVDFDDDYKTMDPDVHGERVVGVRPAVGPGPDLRGPPHPAGLAAARARRCRTSRSPKARKSATP